MHLVRTSTALSCRWSCIALVTCVALLSGCQPLSALNGVTRGSIACSSSKSDAEFPSLGAEHFITTTFIVEGNGRAVPFENTSACEYQGSFCGDGRWYNVWYGKERDQYPVPLPTGDELIYWPHALCLQLNDYLETCRNLGQCNASSHFEMLLMHSQERIESRSNTAGAVADRELVTGDQLQNYGIGVHDFKIEVQKAEPQGAIRQ